MQKHRLHMVFAMPLIVVLIAACGTTKGSDGNVSDYDSLVKSLREGGATVEQAGTLSQPFFAPEAQLLTVNGQQVQVFEFGSAAAAEEAGKSVSADGGSVGTSMISWVASPHFYRAGRIVTLYTGEDSGVIGLLQAAMGAQFAGR